MIKAASEIKLFTATEGTQVTLKLEFKNLIQTAHTILYYKTKQLNWKKKKIYIYIYMGRCPRQTIQHHSNSSLCLNNWHWRSWSWTVLWRPTRPSRTNTKLECKSRKSRYTPDNRQIWPQSTKWSKAANILVILNTLFQQSKWWFYIWTLLQSQCQNQIDYVLCN